VTEVRSVGDWGWVSDKGFSLGCGERVGIGLTTVDAAVGRADAAPMAKTRARRVSFIFDGLIWGWCSWLVGL
jgi:hypothetical protein